MKPWEMNWGSDTPPSSEEQREVMPWEENWGDTEQPAYSDQPQGAESTQYESPYAGTENRMEPVPQPMPVEAPQRAPAETMPTAMDYARSQQYGVLERAGEAYDRGMQGFRGMMSNIPGIDMYQAQREREQLSPEVQTPTPSTPTQYRPEDDRLDEDGNINVKSEMWKDYTPQQILVKARELQAMPKKPSQIELAKAYEPDLEKAYEGYNADGSIDASHERWKDMDAAARQEIVAKDLEFKSREDVQRLAAFREEAKELSMTPEEKAKADKAKPKDYLMDFGKDLLAAIDKEAGFGDKKEMEDIVAAAESIPDYFDLPSTGLSQYAAQEGAYGEGADDYVAIAQREADKRGITLDEVRKENLADAVELMGTMAAGAATGGIGAGSGLLSRIATQGALGAGIDTVGGMVGNTIADRDLTEGLLADAVAGYVGGGLGGILGTGKATKKSERIADTAELFRKKQGELDDIVAEQSIDVRNIEQLRGDLDKKAFTKDGDIDVEKLSRGKQALDTIAEKYDLYTVTPTTRIVDGKQVTGYPRTVKAEQVDDLKKILSKEQSVAEQKLLSDFAETDTTTALMKLVDKPGGMVGADLSYASDELNKALGRGGISQIISGVGSLAEKASFGIPKKFRNMSFDAAKKSAVTSLTDSIDKSLDAQRQYKPSGTRDQKRSLNIINDLETLRGKVTKGSQLSDKDILTFSKLAGDTTDITTGQVRGADDKARREALKDYLDLQSYFGKGEKFKADSDVNTASLLAHLLTGGTLLPAQTAAIAAKNITEFTDKNTIRNALMSERSHASGFKPGKSTKYKPGEEGISLRDFVTEEYGRGDVNRGIRQILNNYIRSEDELSDAIEGEQDSNIDVIADHIGAGALGKILLGKMLSDTTAAALLSKGLK